MVVSLGFVLRGVNKEPGCGGINLVIGIINCVGCLTGTVVRHDANNNLRYVSAVRGYGNNILSRGRGRGRRREFHLCIFIERVVTGRNEWRLVWFLWLQFS